MRVNLFLKIGAYMAKLQVVVGRIAERLKLITLSVYVCYRDDVQLEVWHKPLIKQSDDVCELRVYYMTADSAGTYCCVASNVAGRAECKAQVTVDGKLME